MASTMQGTASPTGGNLGLRVLLKDTMTDEDGVGLQPPIFQALDNPLHLHFCVNLMFVKQTLQFQALIS